MLLVDIEVPYRNKGDAMKIIAMEKNNNEVCQLNIDVNKLVIGKDIVPANPATKVTIMITCFDC